MENVSQNIASANYSEHGTQEQLAALYGALALAKLEFADIEKDATVKIEGSRAKYEFEYATLGSLLEATVPSLSKHGLVVLQPFGGGRPVQLGDETHLACEQLTILAHRDGGRVIVRHTFIEKIDVKDFGGQCTYMQRYAYRSILALGTGEDMDDMPERSRGEESARRVDKPQVRQQQPARQQEKPKEKTPPLASKQLVDDLNVLVKKFGPKNLGEAKEVLRKALVTKFGDQAASTMPLSGERLGCQLFHEHAYGACEVLSSMLSLRAEADKAQQGLPKE